MKRSVVAVGGCALMMTTTGLAADAQAATPTWLSVLTAKTVTAYNGHGAIVTPRATARGQRLITSLRITAYKGSKRVASGKTVRLRPGLYRTVTSGSYRPYTITSQTRSRSAVHKAATAPATCTVTRTEPFMDPFGGADLTSSTATCKNPYYPGQPKTDFRLIGYGLGYTYTMNFPFTDEVVTVKYVVKSRKYGRNLAFSSSRRSLQVRDGGRR